MEVGEFMQPRLGSPSLPKLEDHFVSHSFRITSFIREHLFLIERI